MPRLEPGERRASDVQRHPFRPGMPLKKSTWSRLFKKSQT